MSGRVSPSTRGSQQATKKAVTDGDAFAAVAASSLSCVEYWRPKLLAGSTSPAFIKASRFLYFVFPPSAGKVCPLARYVPRCANCSTDGSHAYNQPEWRSTNGTPRGRNCS
ncbi:hypothetical protein MTO96_005571 [Rhipicephalus appendiculatus]